MGRRALALFIATVVALIGVAAVFLYVRAADSRALQGQSPVDVYVSTKPVAAGMTLQDALDQGLITKSSAASRAVPTGALTRVTPATQRLVALTDIAPGEFVLQSRFGTTPSGSKAIQVPKGMVAISIELKDPARVGKFVTPGSRIVIFDSYKIKALGGDEASKTLNEADVRGTSVLLEDVLVIGMGQSSLTPVAKSAEGEDREQQQTEASFLVTVAVPPKDSTKLVHGINNATLYAGLRGQGLNMDDADQVNDLSIHDLSEVRLRP